LPGRKPSRLTPTNVGTLCAFFKGCEKCGLVLFYSDRPHLNKGVLVMVVFPMAFVTVPVPIVVVMPVFVVPIVVPSIFVSLDW
jgi:hypothetical protein